MFKTCKTSISVPNFAPRMFFVLFCFLFERALDEMCFKMFYLIYFQCRGMGGMGWEGKEMGGMGMEGEGMGGMGREGDWMGAV